MFKAKTIMFDLDGTLIDSVPDLAWSIDRMCEDLGLPQRGPDKVRLWVGNGVRALVRRAIADAIDPGPETGDIDMAIDLFTTHHAGHCCVNSKLYPTVFETLSNLYQSGAKLALVTNKIEKFTLVTLEHFGISQFFHHVLSFDSMPVAKPDPRPLLAAMDRLGSPGIFVGDSETDVLAARNAGIPVICLSYGYNHGQPIEALKPDAVIHQLDALLPLIKVC